MKRLITILFIFLSIGYQNIDIKEEGNTETTTTEIRETK
jgi:hypothetical protein